MQQDQELIVVSEESAQLATPLQLAGQAANAAAINDILGDYQRRKSEQTLRRLNADIALLERFLQAAGVPVADMANDLTAWRGMSYGLVDGFVKWMLAEGYAIGSINVRLSSVKTYCVLAARAGHLNGHDLALIKSVSGYRVSEGHRVDADRKRKHQQTRRQGAKKATPIEIAPAAATLLKNQPDTPRGRRDRLMVCFLLDHGLRVSEVADLNRGSLDLEAGMLRFYRRKVSTEQLHQLTTDTWQAARAYLADRDPENTLDAQEPLFAGTSRARDGRYSIRAINDRMNVLAAPLGLKKLSPHDGRHYWATVATRAGTDTRSLQDAGGWSSPAMPLRYAARSHIANQNVKLS